MRWTRSFDFVDGLDFVVPSPSSTPGCVAFWDETRKGLESQRVWHAERERQLIWRGICRRVRGEKA